MVSQPKFQGHATCLAHYSKTKSRCYFTIEDSIFTLFPDEEKDSILWRVDMEKTVVRLDYHADGDGNHHFKLVESHTKIYNFLPESQLSVIAIIQHLKQYCIILQDYKEKFRILHLLGRGGYAKVYKAVRKYDQGIVALKFIKKRTEKRTPKCVQDSVINEARVLKSLSDLENVLKLDEVYENHAYYILVTEFLEGESLKKYLSNYNYLHEKAAKTQMVKLLLALREVHRRKIVHRDIKPDNLIVKYQRTSQLDSITLIDFGACKLLSDVQKSGSKICGTLGYMAPEILNGSKYDTRSDMFSVGCVAYSMLTGFSVFQHYASRHELMEINKACRYDLKNFIWQGLTSHAKDFIRHLLEVSPTRRMSTHEALCHPWLQPIKRPLLTPEIKEPHRRASSPDVKAKSPDLTPKRYSVIGGFLDIPEKKGQHREQREDDSDEGSGMFESSQSVQVWPTLTPTIDGTSKEVAGDCGDNVPSIPTELDTTTGEQKEPVNIYELVHGVSARGSEDSLEQYEVPSEEGLSPHLLSKAFSYSPQIGSLASPNPNSGAKNPKLLDAIFPKPIDEESDEEPNDAEMCAAISMLGLKSETNADGIASEKTVKKGHHHHHHGDRRDGQESPLQKRKDGEKRLISSIAEQVTASVNHSRASPWEFNTKNGVPLNSEPVVACASSSSTASTVASPLSKVRSKTDEGLGKIRNLLRMQTTEMKQAIPFVDDEKKKRISLPTNQLSEKLSTMKKTARRGSDPGAKEDEQDESDESTIETPRKPFMSIHNPVKAVK